MLQRCLMALVFAGLVAGTGCRQVNRIYDKDTGEMEAVPGPPPTSTYEPQTSGRNDAAAVDFVEPLPDADTIVIQPLPAEPAAPPAPPAPPRLYTIQKGDSFWKIAKQHYGNGMRMKDIEAANPDVNPAKLQVGDQIILPD